MTTIRRSVGPWPHVANFQISVSRNFNWHGKKRSYLSASCPAPPGFTGGFLSFARATYTFAGGKQLTAESVRSCQRPIAGPTAALWYTPDLVSRRLNPAFPREIR